MPEGVEEGIRRGMYLFKSVKARKETATVSLLGSGAIFNEAVRAAGILAEKYNISSDIYSVTSYKTLRFEALEADRWNRLHPGEKPRSSYLHDMVRKLKGPVVSSSDYVRLVGEQIAPWVKDYKVLGTDGFGRSEGRRELRRFFEVDAENIVLATLESLVEKKKLDKTILVKAVKQLGIDPEKKNPLKD